MSLIQKPRRNVVVLGVGAAALVIVGILPYNRAAPGSADNRVWSEIGCVCSSRRPRMSWADRIRRSLYSNTRRAYRYGCLTARSGPHALTQMNRQTPGRRVSATGLSNASGDCMVRPWFDPHVTNRPSSRSCLQQCQLIVASTPSILTGVLSPVTTNLLRNRTADELKKAFRCG